MDTDRKQVISPKRYPVDTPATIVDSEGKFVFGTFKTPFPSLNLLDAKKPCGIAMTRCVKKTRIKDWEAVEVAFREGFLVAAVYSIGIIGFNIFMFYDNQTQEVSVWQTLSPAGKIQTHDTLIDSVKQLKTGAKSELRFDNNFEKGQATVSGNATDKKLGSIAMYVQLDSVSPPSIVSIPFGENRALYSHKEFFRVQGSLKINDRVITADESTVAIIDDHKGYYPRDMHYYWVTGMGYRETEGTGRRIAFNLTENQSINPTDHNENLIWLDGVSSPLPPVHFTFGEEDGPVVWHARDEFGRINVDFYPKSNFELHINAAIIRLNYIAPFGELRGSITADDGTVYSVEGLSPMGEDKHFVV